nr:nuclear pore complex protein NUP205 [Ipomoea batatas]
MAAWGHQSWCDWLGCAWIILAILLRGLVRSSVSRVVDKHETGGVVAEVVSGERRSVPLRESKSEPSFPAAFLFSQPALNRLDLTDALSTLVLIPFLLRFKIAARHRRPPPLPSSIFGRHRRTASQKGLQSPFAQAARPSPSCLRSLSHTALAGRRSRRPPALCRRVFGRLRNPPSPVAVRTANLLLNLALIHELSFAIMDGFPLESMQRVCTLEAELALLLRISYKYRKSGAQGSHHRFETKFGRELSVDVDKQRMVSNKFVRGVLEFIRGHALLFDQILREDLSGADELTMEKVNLVVSILTKIWPYEESDDYGFVQGLFTMMRVIFSLDLDSFISNKSMCYIEIIVSRCILKVLRVTELLNVLTQSTKLDFLHNKVLDTKDDAWHFQMDGMSESEFNQALNIELKHVIEVLSL